METRTADQVNDSTERLLEDLRNVVRDGEELLKAGSADVGEHGAAARERLETALEAARELKRRLENQAGLTARTMRVAVQEHPLQAVGIALGLGLILGMLANRR